MASVIDTVKTTLAENLTGPFHKAAGEPFTREDVPDQTGKVAVITGGSEGIGYGASFTLLSKNISKIFIISLSKEVADGASKDVAEKLGADKAERITWIECDMGDWRAVVAAAKQIRDSTDRIDILVNNAARGIMTYQLTDYGLDRHMAVNHFGHVIFTSHLLPVLKKTASQGHTVRISAQASNAHESVPKDIKFQSIEELNTDLGPLQLYGRSKLAAILYMRYLARHLTKDYPNILANATHPGVVETKMSTEEIHEPYPIAGYGMSTLLKPLKKSQWEGCVSTLYAVTKTENSGEYVCPPAIIEPGSEFSRNDQLGEDLMVLTRKIITDKTEADSVDKGCPMKDY